MLYVWATGEIYAGFGWGDLREGEHLEDLVLDGRIILKWTLKIWHGRNSLYWSCSR